MRLHVGGLAVLLLACPASQALAARSYDNCTGYIESLPATISTQGTWCLRKDVATAISAGAAIQVDTNNVTIDCNDFKIGGLAAGLATQADGILALTRSNITVRNCNVRGFRRGIALVDEDFMLASGSGHVVENNRLNANTVMAMQVEGEGSMIRQNMLFDTGGAPAPYASYGIVSRGSIDVIDNTISNVFVDANANAGAIGISASQNGGTIQGNRIRGLLPSGTGKAFGILAQTVDGLFMRVHPTTLRDNDVLLAAPSAGSVGLHCGYGDMELAPGGRARDNVIQGFQTAIAECGDAGGNDTAAL
jgi:hypothetical protein